MRLNVTIKKRIDGHILIIEDKNNIYACGDTISEAFKEFGKHVEYFSNRYTKLSKKQLTKSGQKAKKEFKI